MQRVGKRRLLSACTSLVGLVCLGYVAGAGAMFYHWPTSRPLAYAFVGACAWSDGKEATASPVNAIPASISPVVEQPGKAFAGLTLYSCAADTEAGTQAFLINMECQPVHRWSIRFSQVWPDPRHLDFRPIDSAACFFGSYLYGNGDLLVVFHGTPTGYGLAKLDRESNLLWSYPAKIHHDVDVAEDGTIYALEQELLYEMPPGLESIPTPCLVDNLIVLSPEGKLLQKPIAILTAFRDSPYRALLATLERPAKRHEPPAGSTSPKIRHLFPGQDAMHTNCVRVLPHDLAARFPGFHAGQVMVSVRNLGVLATIDPDQGRVVWATRGPWLAQHDPQFLDNGHLLLFDNLGSPKGSRVLEFDPQTSAIPWSYPPETNETFFSSERGMCQRLPNGNTFIVNSERGEMIEVTQDKEVAWALKLDRFVTTARRYSTDQLPFLAGASNALP